MKQTNIILIAILVVNLIITAQTPKFELIKNDLTLTRTAQPHQYMDKIGT
ncbi:MAG: hypothetical protein GYA14_07895, partial [Ignavibacteria bacterium]|nr:hypothetical protein [Ignavibacteria bacterium]